MHLEAPSLPEPTTALVFYWNMNTDTHDTEMYDKTLILHIIFLSCSSTSKQIKVSFIKSLIREFQNVFYDQFK